MQTATIYKCPNCKVALPFDQAVLEGGNLVVSCPKCHNTIVLVRHPRCKLCSRQATHMKMEQLGRYSQRVYEANYLCDVHQIKPSDKAKCIKCGTLIPKKNSKLQAGSIVLICPSCQSETVLLDRVSCDQCLNSAVYFGWTDHPNEYSQIIKLGCEEHKFNPTAFVEGPRNGTVLIAFLLTLAGFAFPFTFLISLPLSIYATFKAKEKSVKIRAGLVLLMNAVIAFVVFYS